MTDDEYKAFLSTLKAKAAVITESSDDELIESFLHDDVAVMEYELACSQKRHPDWVRVDVTIDSDLHLKYALAARRKGVATTDLIVEELIKEYEMMQEEQEVHPDFNVTPES